MLFVFYVNIFVYFLTNILKNNIIASYNALKQMSNSLKALFSLTKYIL